MPAIAPDDLDAVVFDFYATLAEAPGFVFENAIDTLIAHLDDGLPRAEFVAAYRRQVEGYVRERALADGEQHNTTWVARALTECGRAATPDTPKVVAAVDAYFDLYRQELRVYTDADATLSRLHERYRLAVLSNFTDPRPVRGTLADSGLARHFDTIVISAEVGQRKPHPAIFATALERLGVAPARALYIGDDPEDDVAGARAAGLRTAWIRRPHRPMLRLELRPVEEPEVTADVTIAELGELVGLLL